MTQVSVLLVEDNPADADLTCEMLMGGEYVVTLLTAVDGVDALDILNQRGRHADAPRPDLILLDLNLPRVDGREVLERIKSRKDLQEIPVIILTSSDAESDVHTSYALGANCYITKPVDFHTYRNVVRSMEGFWFSIVKLPGTPEAEQPDE